MQRKLHKTALLVSLIILTMGFVACGDKTKDVDTQEPPTVQVTPETQVVEFTDPNLDAVIREVIGKASGPIYLNEVSNLENLEGLSKGRGIKNLTGIEYLTGLKELSLRENEITDVSPLAKLVNLSNLNLFNNLIDDITPLSELTGLDRLYLSNNNISNVLPLRGGRQMMSRSIFPCSTTSR